MAQTGVYLAIVTIEKIIVMLVMLLPFWQSVRLRCSSCAAARKGMTTATAGKGRRRCVLPLPLPYLTRAIPRRRPAQLGSAMGLDRMPKAVEEGVALLLFPFVVTACWFWLVDNFLLDDAERIEFDPVCVCVCVCVCVLSVCVCVLNVLRVCVCVLSVLSVLCVCG